jgi:predicted ATPase/DNA-binding CsgD family transcriptional regulator
VDSAGRAWQTVLVLDNCEHVLDAVAEVVAELLETVPGLTVLATSREPIGWADEHVVAVRPLPRRDALALFLERAEAAGRSITTADQIGTAHSICRHVDNNPLFIRLAAARLLRRPLTVILRELNGESGRDQRMRWSHGIRMGDGSRHRGIGDAIAWSYDLCSDAERVLFERMSVFASGFPLNPDDDADPTMLDVGADLEAIQAVCADEPHGTAGTGAALLPRHHIEDLLDRLVDRSMVSAHITQETVRYSLLESLQVFARQRLDRRSTAATDESEVSAERHLRYYRDKVVDIAANWFGPNEQNHMSWVRASWDNVLTALRTSVENPALATLGLQICISLLALPIPFNSSLREVRLWTERTLAATTQRNGQATELRITATALLVLVMLRQGARDDAERMLADCVATSSVDTDDKRRWRDTIDTDIGLPAAVEFAWGLDLWLVRHDVRAARVLTRAATKSHRTGDSSFAAYCEMAASAAAAMLGAESADELIEGFLDRATTAGSRWATSWAGIIRAVTLIRQGDASRALELIHDALLYHASVGDQWGGMWAVHLRVLALGQILATGTDAGADPGELTARATEIGYLLGGLGAMRARFGSNLETPPEFTERTTAAIALAHQLLGAEAFTTAQEQGARLRSELNEVQQLALGKLELPRPTMPHARPAEGRRSPWDLLTNAEQYVAILAAAGWTNAAIAERRGTSLRTVEAQLAAILRKLAIESRRDIAELVPESRTTAVRDEAARWADRRAE